jgi:hypothetical protein
VKRSRLNAGAKSVQRGSTFASHGNGLKRNATLKPSAPRARPRGISPATPAQRARTVTCVVTGARRDEGWTVDPAHLCPRGLGGCNDPLCVVGLRRDLHDAFDQGELDLLPWLIAHGMVAEIQHALEHYRGDLLGLAARLCGERAFVPEGSTA